MNNTIIGLVTLLLAVVVAPTTPALATPTPIPGGANQLAGTSGTLSSTFFNGKLRFKSFVLRKSTPDEQTADPGGLALTLTYIVSNGTSGHLAGSVPASMADADAIVVNGKPKGIYGAYYGLDPATAARGTILFSLPAGFVPVKILLVPTEGVALRINLKPSDIPAAAPAATPSP